jgi:hypothetical protein
VGDQVFLKMTPSRENLRHPKDGKLSPKYIRQFPSIERIRTVVYRIKLLDGLTGIHNMFHVSLLKKYNLDPNNVLNDEPLQL